VVVYELGYDLDWLLKLRLVVARCGEMDCARWWNTDGQLGPRGASVLRRGFPRTHFFAQARSVFAAAEARCAELFNLPGSRSLWWLGEEVEEAFDLQWEVWLDEAEDWRPFFTQLAQTSAADPQIALSDLGLINEAQLAELAQLTPDASGHSVDVGATFDIGAATPASLAGAFSKGAPGKLVVPYVLGAT
jgi:hypothetical protein